jgi:hypothetical protein
MKRIAGNNTFITNKHNMTDFINDTYGRRCLKEYRKYVKFFDKHGHEFNETINHHPTYINLQLCVMDPFLKLAPTWKPLRKKLQDCLDKNHEQIEESNNYEPCYSEIELIDHRGRAEISIMAQADYIQHSSIPSIMQSYRKEIGELKYNKHLNCVAYPEQTRCSHMKANMFGTISEHACHELFLKSNACFADKARMDEKSLWQHILFSEDRQVRSVHKNYCDTIQRDLIKCADKYFRLTVLAHEEEKTLEKIDPDFRRMLQVQIRKGPVSVQERRDFEKEAAEEQKQIDDLMQKVRKEQQEQ